MKKSNVKVTKKADAEFEAIDAFARSVTLESLRPLSGENRRKWEAARRGGGRPRKPASERAVAVQITLTPTLLEEVDAFADHTGNSRSQLIAQGLRKVLPRVQKKAS